MMDLKRYWGDIKDIIIKALEEALEKIDKQLAKEISKKASIMFNRTVVAY
ncbi:hypothetical protein ACVXG7_16290 [Enterobacter hormaechei]